MKFNFSPSAPRAIPETVMTPLGPAAHVTRGEVAVVWYVEVTSLQAIILNAAVLRITIIMERLRSGQNVCHIIACHHQGNFLLNSCYSMWEDSGLLWAVAWLVPSS